MPITDDGYFYLVTSVIYVTKEGMKMKGHMDEVLAAAVAAAKAGEVPVAAAITDTKGNLIALAENRMVRDGNCLLYTSPSPRDATLSRMPSSA